ncbi:hypothetical protein QN372_11130, partial [Undibacterium sp. RTI2.1]|uniref:hypothetical protein n=1 Tax=unclassified Undibacterium TaxID=2630295 RepID=UPI002B22DBAD
NKKTNRNSGHTHARLYWFGYFARSSNNMMNTVNLELVEALTADQIQGALNTWEFEGSEILLALVRARDLVLRAGEIDESVLLGLKFAIEHGPSRVVDIACMIARSLTEKYVEAESLISRLARSKRLQGRVGAIMSLPPTLNDDFLAGIIKDLISDKSRRVREMAIAWVGRNYSIQFLPLLRVAMARENDIEMRSFIAKEIALLSDGYYIKRENGTVYVTVVPSSRGIMSGFFNERNKDELSDGQIVEIFLKEKNLSKRSPTSQAGKVSD